MTSADNLKYLKTLRAFTTDGTISATVKASATALTSGDTKLDTNTGDSIDLTVTGETADAEIDADFNNLAKKTKGKITATVKAAKATVKTLDMSADGFSGDTINVEYTNGLINTDINDLNTIAENNGTGTIKGSLTATGDQALTLKTSKTTDTIALNILDTYNNNTTQKLSKLSDLKSLTKGTITADVEGSYTELASLNGFTNDQLTLSTTSTLTADNVKTLDAISAKAFTGYKLSDSSTGVKAHAAGLDSLISGATTAVITEDGSSSTSLNLGSVSTLTNTTDLTYNATNKANVVELSSSLSSNKTVGRTIDFKNDSSSDSLILNVDSNTTFVKYNRIGDTVANGITTFNFTKVLNFDLASAEDKFGIFYSETGARSGTSLMTNFIDLKGNTTIPAYKLRDGRVYEDENVGELSAADAANTSVIRSKIASVIESGGVEKDANLVGTTKMDFTYIAYGKSSTDSTKTSAYVYAATYDKTQVIANSEFVDSSKLEIAGLAEIVDVTQNVITGNDKNSYLRSK